MSSDVADSNTEKVLPEQICGADANYCFSELILR